MHVELSEDRPPEELILHMRRPEGQRMNAVTVNGRPHADVDADAETIHIADPPPVLEIHIEYAG